MELPQYNNLTDKNAVQSFASITIDNKRDFDSWYNGHKEVKDLIYRGVNEAKYKNFTSSQREWITKEYSKEGVLYKDFIGQIIFTLKNNSLLKSYFKSNNIAINDILCLVYLQHFSAPTPLLDFTYDLDDALFFALDGLKDVSSSNDIDNYFSIYSICLADKELTKADSFFNNALKKANELVTGFKKDNPSLDVDVELLNNVDKFTSWNNGLSGITKFLIPNPLKSRPVKMNNGDQLLWSNINLIAQEGCLILNSDEKTPLEGLQYTNIECVNIHKLLAEYIKEKYLKGLDRENIYPDNYKIAKEAYNQFKKQL